jgi:hypothetical protein
LFIKASNTSTPSEKPTRYTGTAAVRDDDPLNRSRRGLKETGCITIGFIERVSRLSGNILAGYGAECFKRFSGGERRCYAGRRYKQQK